MTSCLFPFHFGFEMKEVPMTVDVRQRPILFGSLALGAVALLSAGLVGCGSGESADTFANWTAKGGKEHLVTIGQDIRTLVSLSGHGDSSTTDQCKQVLEHVKAAMAYRKLPDDTARGYWEKTLDEVENTATNCVQNKETGWTGGPRLSEAAEAQSAYSSLTISIDRLTKESN